MAFNVLASKSPWTTTAPTAKDVVFALALTRLPAKVPITDPRYGGAVLINPGGPGGSGVLQALDVGRNLQTIVDAETDPDTKSPNSKYFDIIGFDQRGVNNTTPVFSCFPSLFSQRNWELQAEADGILGSSPSSFMRNWERNRALAASCSEYLLTPPDGEDEAVGEHINTAPVTRDMLEIIERHAEWREKHGRAEQNLHDKIHGRNPEQVIARRTKWNRGQEKLLYWGLSYGTVLGTTFSTMFPDRIARAVMDGVVNADKYYHGIGPNAIIDADAVFDKFLAYCNATGPDNCPIYTEGGTAALRTAYDSLDGSIYNASIPVMASQTRGPEVASWTDFKNILRVSMYQPLNMFPLLAQYLQDLSQGNGSSVANFKQKTRSPSYPSSECIHAGLWSPECIEPSQNMNYAMMAIMCSDADYLREMDEDGFKAMWGSLRADSKIIGDYWAGLLLGCLAWKVNPKWKAPAAITANTSHPLMFISNTLDPVTPLDSAKRMVKKFPGSVLLQQESEGHTTLSSPSSCVSKHIRHYFQTGELPVLDTLCQGDFKPLLGAINPLDAISKEDRDLQAAMTGQLNYVNVHLPL